jgi:hypothetical protein
MKMETLYLLMAFATSWRPWRKASPHRRSPRSPAC